MDSAVAATSPLSTRKNAAVVASITAHALELFDRNSFERTTLDEIALAAGILARTFFWYFRTKEEVVIGTHAAFGPRVTEALKSRPSSENIWISLRRSFDVLAEAIASDPWSAAQSLRIINSAAILRAHRLEKRLIWSESLIPENEPVRYDKHRHRRRRRLEIICGHLKDRRRVATRYDRCPTGLFSAVALAATVIFWL